LLADMLFVGGALLGASVLTHRPFFEPLLEGQHAAKPVPVPDGTISCTEAYPSDNDMDEMRVTCAYPSDSDSDDVRRRIKCQGPTSQSKPFWSWFA
jgi:hypothetical protein